MDKTLDSWDVIVPERRAGIGQQQKQGSVCLHSVEAGTEYVRVPASAARALAKIKRSEDTTYLSYGDVESLIRKIVRRTAQERIAKMLSRREHSRKEVWVRLRDEGFEKDVIREAVDHAIEIGLLSNDRFARSFIRGKVSSGWGMERIERELLHRGVSTSDVEGWPYEFLDPEEEYERAREIAARKRVKEPNAYAKLMRFLVGRGFSYDVSTRVTKATLNNRLCE